MKKKITLAIASMITISSLAVSVNAKEVTLQIGNSTATSDGKAAEPKELYVVPGAMHIDLYDDVSKIPFNKIEDFFNKNLK